MNSGTSALRPKSLFRRLLRSCGPLAAAVLLAAAFVGLSVPAAAGPSLGVMTDYNWVNGFGFPADTEVTLSANGGAKGALQVSTAADGSFVRTSWWDADVPGQQLLPGDTITATFAGGSAQMTIQDVAGFVDRAGNRLLGTAREPGPAGAPLSGKTVKAMVYLDYAAPPLLTVTGTTDAAGEFEIDLSPFDVTLQHKVGFVIFSGAVVTPTDQGPRTIREAHNVVPSLGAMAQQNWIDGNGFPKLATVTIAVNGGAKGTQEAATDSSGNFWLGWWNAGAENTLAVGDAITATYSGGSAQMTILEVSAEVDCAADSVAGKALAPGGGTLANRRVRVGVYDPRDWTELAAAETATDAGGNFAFDLSSSHDLVRGEIVQVMLWEAPDGSATGHRTYSEAYNSIPTLETVVRNNWIGGWGFPGSTSVTISVNGGAKGTQEAQTDEFGNLGVNWWSEGEANRILPGDTVTAVYGSDTHEMAIPDLQATADVGRNRITGTAFDPGSGPPAGRMVQATIYAVDWGEVLTTAETTVGVDGSFTVDLGSFDLVRGQKIWLSYWDAADGSMSGNMTSLEVYNGIPALGVQVDHNWIRGNDFPPETDLTVALNGGAKGTATVTTDSWGNFFRNWADFGDGPRPKDTVTATHGAEVTEMIVQDIQATVAVGSDTVSGTARDAVSGDPLDGEKVSVSITLAWDQQEPHAGMEATVDAGGGFTFAFAGTWDIKRSDAILLTYTSPEGHQTIRQPSSIDITGTVRRDAADGPGLPGVVVRVENEANTVTDERAVLTDDQGAYTFTGLHPGIYKVFFDPAEYNRQHPATNYQSEWHVDKADFNAGNWIVVPPNGDAQVIDAVLEDTGGGLAGTVTGNGDVRLEGIWICVQSASWTELQPNCAHLAPTDSAGDYAISGVAPGDYRIFFSAGEYNESHPTSYASHWHGSVVPVAKGVIVQVDARMGTGGTVAGTVTGQGELLLPGIEVHFFTESGLWAGETATDGNGDYSLSLPQGTYQVRFSTDEYNGDHDTDYVSQWYHEPDTTEAALVAVTAGDTTPDIDAQLAVGGRVMGRVFGAEGAPVRGVLVEVFPAGDGGERIDRTLTNAEGRYLIRGLAPDDYKIRFDPVFYNQGAGTDYLPEWHQNKPDFGSATRVPVGAGETAAVKTWLARAGDRLVVASPSAGVTWAQGSPQTIAWEGRVATGSVKILLVKGVTATTIVASTPNDGSFDWVVPGNQAPGNTYQVRVVWLSNPAVFADSSPFTVTSTDGPIVAGPAPGTATQGAVHPITWSGIPQTGSVKILLVKGVTATTIVASTPNDGSFDWVVPGAQAPGAYTVKVVWLSKPTVPCTGAGLTVTSTDGPIVVGPAPGTAAQGAVQTITWSGVPQTGNVKILLVKGTAATTIVASTPNDGSFDWVVPGAQTAGDYTLKVVWLSKPAVPCAGAPFTVTATEGPIVVTPLLPSVAQGVWQTINWTGIPQTGNVKILLVKGVTATTIVASTPNDGSFKWLVPGTLAEGSYKLKVTWLSKPAVPDNGAAFTALPIVGPIMVGPSPASAAQGKVHTIEWGGIPKTGNVKILLVKGVAATTIVASTPNDGSFDWTVPGAQAVGDYTLKVVWLSKPAVPCTGGTFTVTATDGPIVVGPAPGTAAQGAVHPITWSGIPRTGSVKILLVKGTAATTIVASTPNDGSFDWVVPGAQATGDYTLKVVWLSKPAVPCPGAALTVTPTTGSFAVTAPAAPVRQGAVRTIAWSGGAAIPQTGSVKILLVKGLTATTIVASTPNDGSFDWTVPGLLALGDDYKVRVVWLSKPTVTGESATFSVIGP